MARKGREWSPRGPSGIHAPFAKGNVIIPQGKTYPDMALEVLEVLDKNHFEVTPVGGGHVMIFGPVQIEKYKLRLVTPEEMEPRWRKGIFWMDFLEREYPGWTSGDLWNGWATPFFERKVAEAVLRESQKAFGEISQEYEWSYDPKTDLFKFKSESDEEADKVRGEWIETPEGRKLYGLGAYSWTWSEKESEE